MVCALLQLTVTGLLIAVFLRCQFHIIPPPAIRLILQTGLLKSQALCVTENISTEYFFAVSVLLGRVESDKKTKTLIPFIFSQ